VRQVGSVLVKLALQLVNDAGEFAALLDKPGDDVSGRSRVSGNARAVLYKGAR
jgi:hypothetical protein